ncbi:hypothetical protein RFI_23732 [Reticulomyxa filosa]|uniref:Uncharacterized protein n=1 Tax=Reticulomyxa filosa TaxID=46433 RepID=X6MJK4_RETFI|nr:hypothetical protein RFI_23732 [Reticulomyxa filosa]|eukprot:ETO13627.1 hypothetical protein RFI_23732 [Reticulomyxa filosa]
MKVLIATVYWVVPSLQLFPLKIIYPQVMCRFIQTIQTSRCHLQKVSFLLLQNNKARKKSLVGILTFCKYNTFQLFVEHNVFEFMQCALKKKNSPLLGFKLQRSSLVICRKLEFENKYNQQKQYDIISDDINSVRVVNSVLVLKPQQKSQIELELAVTQIEHFTKNVLLFVTESGKLEDCFQLEIRKGHITNL